MDIDTLAVMSFWQLFYYIIYMKIHILSVVSALHEIIYSFIQEDPVTYYETAEIVVTTCKPKHKMWTKTEWDTIFIILLIHILSINIIESDNPLYSKII